jgi:hypothetical protein
MQYTINDYMAIRATGIRPRVESIASSDQRYFLTLQLQLFGQQMILNDGSVIDNRTYSLMFDF